MKLTKKDVCCFEQLYGQFIPLDRVREVVKT